MSTGVGYCSGIVGAPALSTTLGTGEEMGAPRALFLPLTQQDLAQVNLLPWPWLKLWKKRRFKFYSTDPRRNSESQREVRENPATASSVRETQGHAGAQPQDHGLPPGTQVPGRVAQTELQGAIGGPQ